MDKEKNNNIRKVIIIVNTSKKESLSLSDQICDYLRKKNISCEILNFDGFGKSEPLNNCDLVITLGGDGTVLYAARNCVEYDVPIFPINLGQFGFMAPVQQDEWKSELNAFFEGKSSEYSYQYRSMLKAELYRNNELIYSSLGLNDLVLGAKHISHTVALDIFYDDSLLCKLKSDGVIVSTTTGSTAYSASAGGPIVDPVLDAFILTPINSFSLSSRPIVLSPEGKITLNMLPGRTKHFSMIVDGQEPVEVYAGDRISVTTFEKKVKLIHCTQGRFYDALRSKLNWRGEPYAGRIVN